MAGTLAVLARMRKNVHDHDRLRQEQRNCHERDYRSAIRGKQRLISASTHILHP